MTCIAAIKSGQHVYMSADSAIYTGNNTIMTAKPYEKLMYKNNFLIGASGLCRFAHIIKHCFDVPSWDGKSFDSYLNNCFVPELRDCCTKAGFTRKENDRESNSSTLMIAIGNELFMIGSDYSVIEVDKFFAIGSGADYAIGALAVCAAMPYKTDNNSRLAVESAVSIACIYDPWVSPPVYSMRSKEYDPRQVEQGGAS